MTTGASFSPDRRYRYRLTRVWDDSLPTVCFIMLNPSTADEVQNDPTIERCRRRASQMGFGGLVAVNIFALRSTDPARLYVEADPVGPENDAHIRDAATASGLVICGWGEHGSLLQRGATVLTLLRDAGVIPHALKMNLDGSPAHPLYIGYRVLPTPMPTNGETKTRPATR